MNIYHVARKVFKLPRPNEVWGEQAMNVWNPLNLYLYSKFAFSSALSHVGIVLGVLQTVLMFSIKFEAWGIGGPLAVALLTGGGILSLFLIGHILFVFGVIKRENTMTQSQNKELMEIKQAVKEIQKSLI